MVYTKAKAQSDSEYNFSADSDGNSSDASAPALVKPRQLSMISHLSDHSLINYKKAAQSWSIEQIADEINTLSAQLERLKSEALREPGEGLSGRQSRAKRNKNVHCFCAGKYSLSSPMVQCDYCDVWYHQICVGLTQIECDQIQSFECRECQRERAEEAKLKSQRRGAAGRRGPSVGGTASSSLFGVNFEEIRVIF